MAVDGVLGMACGDCDFCRTGQMFHCPVRRAAPTFGGGFAEVLKRRPAGFFPLPAGVTPQQGALVEPLAVGVHGVRYPRMQPGASVVILGAGHDRADDADRGAGTRGRRGPHHGAPPAAGAARGGAWRHDRPAGRSGRRPWSRSRDLTGGLGADLVVETVGGHADTLNLAWDLVRPAGHGRGARASSRGASRSTCSSRSVREVWVTFPVCYGVIDGRHDYDVAIELIASGRAPVDRLVTSRFPLKEAPAAFRTAADKSTGSVKVHLTDQLAAEPHPPTSLRRRRGETDELA